MRQTRTYRAGADIGGTFTDLFFQANDGTELIHKVPSTPDDYGRAIVDGIREVITAHAITGSQIRKSSTERRSLPTPSSKARVRGQLSSRRGDLGMYSNCAGSGFRSSTTSFSASHLHSFPVGSGSRSTNECAMTAVSLRHWCRLLRESY